MFSFHFIWRWIQVNSCHKSRMLQEIRKMTSSNTEVDKVALFKRVQTKWMKSGESDVKDHILPPEQKESWTCWTQQLPIFSPIKGSGKIFRRVKKKLTTSSVSSWQRFQHWMGFTTVSQVSLHRKSPPNRTLTAQVWKSFQMKGPIFEKPALQRVRQPRPHQPQLSAVGPGQWWRADSSRWPPEPLLLALIVFSKRLSLLSALEQVQFLRWSRSTFCHGCDFKTWPNKPPQVGGISLPSWASSSPWAWPRISCPPGPCGAYRFCTPKQGKAAAGLHSCMSRAKAADKGDTHTLLFLGKQKAATDGRSLNSRQQRLWGCARLQKLRRQSGRRRAWRTTGTPPRWDDRASSWLRPQLLWLKLLH